MTEVEQIKLAILRRLRNLRVERRIPQAALASKIGLSQSRFSQVERGQGSFSAEQLVLLLKAFNVSLSDLISEKPNIEATLQNSLAKFGATHLQIDNDSLPSEKLKDAAATIREALVWAESPRQVAAIAPVLVENSDRINFNKLADELQSLGLENRLGWVIDNVRQAIKEELSHPLPREYQLRYRRAEVQLARSGIMPPHFRPGEEDKPNDILDAEINSEKSVEQVSSERSTISRNWKIISRLQPEDFLEALRGARARKK